MLAADATAQANAVALASAQRGDALNPGRAGFPFELGNQFGYLRWDGRFLIKETRKGYLSLSPDYWALYDRSDEPIAIRDMNGAIAGEIANPRGFPLFIDGKIFIINDEQNSLQRIDADGTLLWKYDFSAPITDIDAATDMILLGTLDGTVELLNDEGKRVYYFEPGGSRLSVILSCRISRDGSTIAIISGYDDQRFLLLEQSGDGYRISYHEFLSNGFRRAVHLAFIDNDQRVVFERNGGMKIFTIASRKILEIPLDGTILALDQSGEDGLLFVVTALTSRRRKLLGIHVNGEIFMEAPFVSESVFLSRIGKSLYIGGGRALAAFEIDTR